MKKKGKFSIELYTNDNCKKSYEYVFMAEKPGRGDVTCKAIFII